MLQYQELEDLWSRKKLDRCDQVRVTSQLFDLLSDNSSVDHPLCGECTDSLLQVVEAPVLEKQAHCLCLGDTNYTLRLALTSIYTVGILGWHIILHQLNKETAGVGTAT